VVVLGVERDMMIASGNKHGKIVFLTQKERLHLAAWAGQREVVKLLCQKEADVSASAADDMAAIHFASQKGHMEIVRLLLAAGAHVNSRTRKGMTPLHYAVQGGFEDLTKLLIKRGANLQSQTKARKTPIELARTEAFQAVVKAAELERQALRNAKSEPAKSISQPEKNHGTEEKMVQETSSAVSNTQDLGDAQGLGPDENKVQISESTAGRKRASLEEVEAVSAVGTDLGLSANNEETGTVLIGPRSKKAKISLSHLFADEVEGES
jgi:hypothetical protein